MSNTENAEVARDAARVVTSRLTTDPLGSGLRIQVLGKDELGNSRFRSPFKEYDFAKKEELPAEMVVTIEGRAMLSTYPGLLRTIQQGDFQPDKVYQTGSGAVVIHDPEFPKLAIKYLKFQPFIPNFEPHVPPELRYATVQSATGIENLYWKQALRSMDVKTPQPYIATRDVLVEEFINGEIFLEFLQRGRTEVSDQQFSQLVQLIDNFTLQVGKGVAEELSFNEGRFKGLVEPKVLDLAPKNDSWLEQCRDRMNVVNWAFLNNWIVEQKPNVRRIFNLPSEERLDFKKFFNMSFEKQLRWLQTNAVLVDPFANTAMVSEDELQHWIHGIPRYGQFETPQGRTLTQEDIRREREWAGLDPSFIRIYREAAKESGIRKVEGDSFTCIDGRKVIETNGRVRTIPDNLDPRVYQERYAEVGFYSVNGGKVGFVDGEGKKYEGKDTPENIATLEKAGYKKGRVWVELSHGEELAA